MNQTTLPTEPTAHRVAILGASPKSDRYAHLAQKMLTEEGYPVLPIHPKIGEIEGVSVYPDLASVPQPVHTLTLYVGPARSEPLVDAIIALAPQRVIFNPGTESPTLEAALQQQGIETMQACTLVLLRTKQF